MRLSRIAIARDYNRALPAPIRAAHIACAALATAAAAISHFIREGIHHPSRRHWAWPLTLAVAAVLVWPLDDVLSRAARSLNLSGDIRREFEAIQQFGQGASTALLAIAVILLDPRRTRFLLDWAAAAILTALTTNLLKAFAGRPRPALDDPFHFVGPAGLYPVPDGPDSWKLVSPWTSGYDLASMPSRHAAFAAIACVYLSFHYPRLRPLVVALAAAVCTARVVFGAHYPADVFAGAAIGGFLTAQACRLNWGVRAVDFLWIRFVDPRATPALPRLLEARRPHA